jgi:peptide chain release factor 2
VIKEEIEVEIKKLEEDMSSPSFWSDPKKAQGIIKTLKDLKDKKDGGDPHDAGPAIVTIFSGAGGDDSEDFSAMLFAMYEAFLKRKNLSYSFLQKNENSLGGYRNISFEVTGKNAYKMLKGENGVHRLIRISPFNAKGLRHTSFSLVEVLPIPLQTEIVLEEKDLKIEFLRSGGPGGKNVNKRETAVRVTHTPTNIVAVVDSEREQAQNKEKALTIVRAKYLLLEEENRKREAEGLALSKTVSIEWGSQIRTYTLHPYKLVKDHRTNKETSDVKKILEDGCIEFFREED